jgi:hypothetical protein
VSPCCHDCKRQVPQGLTVFLSQSLLFPFPLAGEFVLAGLDDGGFVGGVWPSLAELSLQALSPPNAPSSQPRSALFIHTKQPASPVHICFSG